VATGPKGRGRGGRRTGGGNDDRDRRSEPHKEEGSAIQVHQAYLEHRNRGGEPPSPDAYRRAIEQFQRLPGAVRRAPEVVPDKKPDDSAGGDINDTDGKREGQ